MGYYSEIALALSKKGVKTLQGKLRKAPKEVREDVNGLLRGALQHYSDPATGSEVWHLDWLKWYSEFPEIAFLKSFMENLDVMDYRFIRMGEDYDDFETLGYFYDNPFGIDVRRTIEVYKAG